MKKTIETKFEPGQKVWMLLNSKAVERVVRRVIYYTSKEEERVEYNLVGEAEYSSDAYEYYDESRLFATKEDLKKSIFGD